MTAKGFSVEISTKSTPAASFDFAEALAEMKDFTAVKDERYEEGARDKRDTKMVVTRKEKDPKGGKNCYYCCQN